MALVQPALWQGMGIDASDAEVERWFHTHRALLARPHRASRARRMSGTVAKFSLRLSEDASSALALDASKDIFTFVVVAILARAVVSTVIVLAACLVVLMAVNAARRIFAVEE